MDTEIIQDILKHKSKGKALELGSGEESEYLANHNFKATSVDIQKKPYTKAKQVVTDLNGYHIQEDYDVIYSIATLHFLEKPNAIRLIKEMKEHTSKKGVNVILAFMDDDPTFEEGKAYFKKDELKELYKDWDIINYKEYDEYDPEERHTNKIEYLLAVKR
jgi:uncharacterized UPF0146 family protein